MSRSADLFVARAPVRVDPAGGGTDAPPFCEEYGGAVVNMGVAHHVYASLCPDRSASSVRIVSHDLGEEIAARSLGELPLTGSLRLLVGLAKRLEPDFGFTLEVRSSMPPGSGLGSSGAVGVACAGVFDVAMGTGRTKVQIADLANDVERRDLGMAGGSQDSFGAALGDINLLIYHRGGGMTPRALEVEPAVRYELERRCVLVYTGEVHLSGSIHQDIKTSYALPDSPTVDAMQQLARIGQASADALEAGDLATFGNLLNENWTQHKRLHPSCDNEVLGRYYDATAKLVVGGKTCGAGGGGCILYLCRDGTRQEVEATCRKLGGQLYPFLIDRAGLIRYTVSGGGRS